MSGGWWDGASSLVHDWEGINPEVRTLLLDPGIRTEDPDVLRCGCSRASNLSGDLLFVLCDYHRGWNDALAV